MLGLVVSACSISDRAAPSETRSTTTVRSSPPESAPPSPRANGVSLTAFFDERRTYDGSDLRLGAVRERTNTYTSYDATFRGDGLTISGVLNVPTGPGPFPAVVLAHGYIEPSAYVRGQGMTRERGFFADRGFVAFHVDYRAHAESEGSAQQAEREVQLAYVADVVNAVLALVDSDDIAVVPDRISLMGRSMGGGVVYRTIAAVPDVFNAAAAWASVSSLENENFDRCSRPNPAEVAWFDRAYGLPGTPRGRKFWPGVSSRSYFDRVTVPVLTVHGRSDTTCPPRWARATHRSLIASGVDSTVAWYAGEGHTFGVRFGAAMQRTARFFRAAPRGE